jgi:hypothetical protein
MKSYAQQQKRFIFREPTRLKGLTVKISGVYKTEAVAPNVSGTTASDWK